MTTTLTITFSGGNADAPLDCAKAIERYARRQGAAYGVAVLRTDLAINDTAQPQPLHAKP